MRIYKVKVWLSDYVNDFPEIKETTMILGKEDELEEMVQMAYGSWFDILNYEFEEGNQIMVSKNYLIEEAKKLMRIEWDL